MLVDVEPVAYEPLELACDGDVVVIAGNNARKTEYIAKCISAGFNSSFDVTNRSSAASQCS